SPPSFRGAPKARARNPDRVRIAYLDSGPRLCRVRNDEEKPVMSHVIQAQTVPRPVPALLGFLAGFFDICAYFGLYGIFVAQLTGSFALAGARMVSGQQEFLTLAAIPVFFLAGALAP